MTKLADSTTYGMLIQSTITSDLLMYDTDLEFTMESYYDQLESEFPDDDDDYREQQSYQELAYKHYA